MATDLQTLKMRIPALSDHQLYYQLKNAMDPELSTLVAPHINLNIHWIAIVELAMKYDENRKKRSYTTYSKPKTGYQQPYPPPYQRNDAYRPSYAVQTRNQSGPRSNFQDNNRNDNRRKKLNFNKSNNQ